MSRLLLLLLLVCVAGCGGGRSAPPVAPAVSPDGAHAAPRAHQRPVASPSAISTPEQALLPPAPALDTLVPPEELAAELRLSADSAADEEVLEALDDARPADDDTDESLPATPVTWDIDVET
jgi:hypothetical protein